MTKSEFNGQIRVLYCTLIDAFLCSDLVVKLFFISEVSLVVMSQSNICEWRAKLYLDV